MEFLIFLFFHLLLFLLLLLFFFLLIFLLLLVSSTFLASFLVAGAKTDRDLGGQDDYDKTPVSSVVYNIHSRQVL